MPRLSSRQPPPRSETLIVSEIRAAINAVPGCLAMRNQTGSLQDRNGRHVSFGLAIGSSDIIACCWGRFVCIEVKREQPKATRKRTEHEVQQLEFIEMIEKVGGIGGVAWDVESALAIVERARK